MDSLPPLSSSPPPLSYSPTPSSASEDDSPPTPPTLRALTTETKALYRDVIRFSASPRVVDLSAVNARRAERAAGGGKAWVPRRQTPAAQVMERKAEAERLSRRVKGLMVRASAIAER